jgi:NADH:ubiquinone oxidoreductase subunit 4 (subunit M)
VGLPGLNAFVSEFLTLSSAFSSRLIPLGWSIAAVIGIVLGAAYFLRAFQHSFMGKYQLPYHPEYDGLLTELSRREWILLGVPALFALAGGIRPDWFTGLYTEEVAAWFRVITLTQP